MYFYIRKCRNNAKTLMQQEKDLRLQPWQQNIRCKRVRFETKSGRVVGYADDWILVPDA